MYLYLNEFGNPFQSQQEPTTEDKKLIDEYNLTVIKYDPFKDTFHEFNPDTEQYQEIEKGVICPTDQCHIPISLFKPNEEEQ